MTWELVETAALFIRIVMDAGFLERLQRQKYVRRALPANLPGQVPAKKTCDRCDVFQHPGPISNWDDGEVQATHHGAYAWGRLNVREKSPPSRGHAHRRSSRRRISSRPGSGKGHHPVLAADKSKAGVAARGYWFAPL